MSPIRTDVTLWTSPACCFTFYDINSTLQNQYVELSTIRRTSFFCSNNFDHDFWF
ncbi:MAG: hypothetical protein HY840_12060 [Bacteroidetes bacterium]|nr:hypothetical protein [Bacteroidota bacterium]